MVYSLVKTKVNKKCGEYLFLNDSSCNLASLNLLRFFSKDKDRNVIFDIETFIDVIRTVITAQDIVIDFSSYPSDKIKNNSKEYRPLGLGYTNLAALLMWLGIPYDSDRGRVITSILTGIMQGYALLTSNELANSIGEFIRFKDNKKSYFEVIEKHDSKTMQLYDICNSSAYYKNDSLIFGLFNDLKYIWINKIRPLRDNDNFDLRNAQVSVIAPTGKLFAPYNSNVIMKFL